MTIRDRELEAQIANRRHKQNRIKSIAPDGMELLQQLEDAGFLVDIILHRTPSSESIGVTVVASEDSGIKALLDLIRNNPTLRAPDSQEQD